MPDLRASVGQNGHNRSSDVKAVQRLLNQHLERLTPSRPLLSVDGLIGDKTIMAIIDFQRQVLHFRNPDGRVDPGGRTWAGLQADTASPDSPSPPAAAPSLGQLSEKYETGRRGPGTVSGGQGDAGGVSYGSYQMTSIPNGGTVKTLRLAGRFPVAKRVEEFTARQRPLQQQMEGHRQGDSRDLPRRAT